MRVGTVPTVPTSALIANSRCRFALSTCARHPLHVCVRPHTHTHTRLRSGRAVGRPLRPCSHARAPPPVTQAPTARRPRVRRPSGTPSRGRSLRHWPARAAHAEGRPPAYLGWDEASRAPARHAAACCTRYARAATMDCGGPPCAPEAAGAGHRRANERARESPRRFPFPFPLTPVQSRCRCGHTASHLGRVDLVRECERVLR